eukprot:scaffold32547_cov33-Prasinocladus_malaysianus.AAC.1
MKLTARKYHEKLKKAQPFYDSLRAAEKELKNDWRLTLNKSYFDPEIIRARTSKALELKALHHPGHRVPPTAQPSPLAVQVAYDSFIAHAVKHLSLN